MQINDDEIRKTAMALPVHRRHLLTVGFGGLFGLNLPNLLKADETGPEKA